MVKRMRHYLIVGSLLAIAGPRVGAADLPPKPIPPRIAATQVTLRIDPVQGRATVVAIDGATLTVVTAAHVLATDAVGKPVLVHSRAGSLGGRVASVVWNPHFRPLRPHDPRELVADRTLGIDTAVAVIQVDRTDAGERRAFEAIKPADLAPGPIPSRPDQILLVHIVDKAGEEHVVRAGNHLNPKCLAWGRRAYDTQPGDSGAGVFVLWKSPEGETRPLLIGTVSQTDDRGGIASLASRNEPWIGQAIDGPTPNP